MEHKLYYYISEKAEPLLSSFNPPAALSEVTAFEEEFKVELPEDFKNIYLKFNGQNDLMMYNFLDYQSWLSLDSIRNCLQGWKVNLQKYFGTNWRQYKLVDFGFTSEVKNTLYHDKWIPFLVDDGVYTCIDLSPNEKGNVGQVITIYASTDLQQYEIVLEETSFKRWLNSLAIGLKNETLAYTEDTKSISNKTAEKKYKFTHEADQISDGGSPIYHYEDNKNDNFHLPNRKAVYLEEIMAHIEMYVGRIENIFHENVSDHLHIDVQWVKPTKKHPYHVLVTSGMSDFPMYLPKEVENPEFYRYAEMMVLLPEDWEISEEAFKKEANYWPIRFLKWLARFPHQYESWLGYGHTLPNGEYAEPMANTPFGCLLIMPPLVSFEEDFCRMSTSDGNAINFYVMIPIFKEEMNLKLEKGIEVLLEKFYDFGVTGVIDVNRPNTAL